MNTTVGRRIPGSRPGRKADLLLCGASAEVQRS